MRTDKALLRKTMTKKQWKRMMAQQRSRVGRGMNTGTRTVGPDSYDRNAMKRDMRRELDKEE